MARHPILLVAMVVGVVCILSPAVQGKTETSAQRSQNARSRVDLVGEVIKVDADSQSMTLRSGGNTIGLDISNAVLQGYASITGIKKGDRVGAGYTTDGIHITKLPKIAGKTTQEKATIEKSLPERAAPTSPRVQSRKKPSLFARRMKTDGKSFSAVDNNKDNKISPIELSVVIPNLTIEQFRQYDKNHDGHLNRAEFEQIALP
jgi:hypothetical protein